MDHYLVFKDTDTHYLHKGMFKEEVVKLLGASYVVESCAQQGDEKWVYNFHPSPNTYKLYFKCNNLEWVMKGRFSGKPNVEPLAIETNKKRNNK